MAEIIPRLRMFAGPNGSGKSTFEAAIPTELIGIYVNPDELEKRSKTSNEVDFDDFEINLNPIELIKFLNQSDLLAREGLRSHIEEFTISNNRIQLNGIRMNSYWASAICSFIRMKLLDTRKSFTFETVMSSRDKVELLKYAQSLGYRTYLYFIATEDPLINIARVRHRVLMGGHAVPEDKIVQRYQRALNLLPEAIQASNRAYIFDNSVTHENKTLIAEFTDGKLQGVKSILPEWIKPILREF